MTLSTQNIVRACAVISLACFLPVLRPMAVPLPWRLDWRFWFVCCLGCGVTAACAIVAGVMSSAAPPKRTASDRATLRSLADMLDREAKEQPRRLRALAKRFRAMADV